MSMYQSAEDISDDLAGRLATIRKVNGYETDIGLNVYKGARRIEPEQAPCSTLVEGNDLVEQAKGSIPTAKTSQDYVLGAYVACDPMNPNVAAHAAIRDMKKAIFAVDTTLTGKVRGIEYRGKDIGPRTDGVAVVLAIIEITATFVEDLRNP